MEAANSNQAPTGEPGVTKEALLLQLLDELSAARNLAGKSIRFILILMVALVILDRSSKSGPKREFGWFQIRVYCGLY